MENARVGEQVRDGVLDQHPGFRVHGGSVGDYLDIGRVVAIGEGCEVILGLLLLCSLQLLVLQLLDAADCSLQLHLQSAFNLTQVRQQVISHPL